ncbi:MAG TPA: YrdB family protein [Ktedonobacteraceae bacterium]|nr:YrdB family protein [Ktedonobacteraceae bacterium]
MILTTLKNANLALAFFLELGVLATLGYWGFYTGQGTLARIGLGIGAPAVAVVVWGIFGAPRSTWRLRGFRFLILRVIFFGSAAIALFVAGQRVLSVVFALVFVINLVLIYVWAQ